MDYRIFDADSHYYEPDDCFTRHLEKRYADRAVRVVRGKGNYAQVYVGKDRLKFFTAPPGEVTGPPGMLSDFLRTNGESGGGKIQFLGTAGSGTARETIPRLWRLRSVQTAFGGSCFD